MYDYIAMKQSLLRFYCLIIIEQSAKFLEHCNPFVFYIVIRFVCFSLIMNIIIFWHNVKVSI